MVPSVQLASHSTALMASALCLVVASMGDSSVVVAVVVDQLDQILVESLVEACSGLAMVAECL